MNKDENLRRSRDALAAQMPALRRYATALSGSVAAGDDLVQDCLERALRKWDSLREEDRLGGWLRSIIYNLYVDQLRSRRRRGIEEDIADFANDLSLSVPAGEDPNGISVLTAMKGLSNEHRQILLLVGLEGLSYGEIARELQIPLGTVMSRLARARERLRFALSDTSAIPNNIMVLASHRKVTP